MNTVKHEKKTERAGYLFHRLFRLRWRRCPECRKTRKGDGEDGWTFVETIIVIGIILILTSSVGFVAFRYIDRAKQAAARNEIEAMSLALNAYYLDCKRYPGEEQGIAALWQKPHMEPVPSGWAGPYVNKRISGDPWGNPYHYTVPGPDSLPFGIRSLGADNAEGGEGSDADIASWEN